MIGILLWAMAGELDKRQGCFQEKASFTSLPKVKSMRALSALTKLTQEFCKKLTEIRHTRNSFISSFISKQRK